MAARGQGLDILQKLYSEHPFPIGEDNFLIFLTERLKEDLGH